MLYDASNVSVIIMQNFLALDLLPACWVGVGHDSNTCEKPESCVNGKEDHPAYSCFFSYMDRRKEFVAVKIHQNLIINIVK